MISNIVLLLDSSTSYVPFIWDLTIPVKVWQSDTLWTTNDNLCFNPYFKFYFSLYRMGCGSDFMPTIPKWKLGMSLKCI